MLFPERARARNTHVEATLNHPCPAQVVYEGEKNNYVEVEGLPPPSVATLGDVVDAPALARKALAAAAPADDDADRQRAGKVRFPGGELAGSNPRRVSKVVGGHHMAALGLLPPAPAPVPDKWLSAE